MSLRIHPSFSVPFAELEARYSRSSGKGGQNVNKVNSKVEIRWNLQASPSLRPEIREALFAKLSGKLTREMEIIVTSEKFRDQEKNYDDALEKLRLLLVAATHVPKKRKKTKPTRGSRE